MTSPASSCLADNLNALCQLGLINDRPTATGPSTVSVAEAARLLSAVHRENNLDALSLWTTYLAAPMLDVLREVLRGQHDRRPDQSSSQDNRAWLKRFG